MKMKTKRVYDVIRREIPDLEEQIVRIENALDSACEVDGFDHDTLADTDRIVEVS
jgi:hypothetical protein